MAQDTNSIRFDCNSQGVATITLNREKNRNALNESMLLALVEKLREAESDDNIKVVIITGAGRGFCSGADLTGGLLEENLDKVESWIKEFANPLIEYLRSMSKPVIAAVNGVAAGAGFSVALACDVVISAASARYILSCANINMALDMGASWFLTRKLGTMRTAALAMSAQPLDAQTALQWGIAYEVVEDSELLARAGEFAGQLAAMPAEALAAIKSQLNDACDCTLSEALQHEAQIQGTLVKSAETQRRVRAFSKR